MLPNHWLPVLAIGRKENWTTAEVTWVTFLCALAHAVSTIIIGIVLGLLGWALSLEFRTFSALIAPIFLIVLGLFFIYQHHRHHHFHIHHQPDPSLPRRKIIIALTAGMFLSPCLEIEGYFLAAGAQGTWAVTAIAVIYFVFSVGGMVLWVRWTYSKAKALNWHKLEHNAGIITGIALVATGVIAFFVS